MSLADAVRRDAAGVLAVLRVADKLGLDRRELAWVIEKESGWDPDARNPRGGARGIVQWMPETLRGMKATLPPDLTGQAKLLERTIRGARNEDIYVSIAAPKFIGTPDDTVVFPAGSLEWKENPGLREFPLGDVTTGSIRREGAPPLGFGVPSTETLERLAKSQPKGFSGIGALFVLAALVLSSKRR
jgi:hypothetical protein